MKKLFSLLLIACALMLVACGGNSPEDDTKESTPGTDLPEPLVTVGAPDSTDQSTETSEPDTTPKPRWDSYAEAYRDLALDLKAIIAARPTIDIEASNLPEMSCDINYSSLSTTISEQIGTNDRVSDFGYILFDMNNDGTPELFWVNLDHEILAVFTYHNGQPKLLCGFWSRYRATVTDNGQLFVSGSSGANDSNVTLYTLKSGELENVFEFGTTSLDPTALIYYERTSEQQISITTDRLDDLYKLYTEHCPDWKKTTVYSLDSTPPKNADSRDILSDGECLPYIQQIKNTDQPIMAGPGYDYTKTTTVGEEGAFTVISEITDAQGNLWGRLKSGIGWIDLTDIRKDPAEINFTVTVTNQEKLGGMTYHRYVITEEYTMSLLFRVNKKITDISFFSIDTSVTETKGEEHFRLQSMDSNMPLVVDLAFFGDMTTFGISFKDESGKIYTYSIYDSLRDGTIIMQPFNG